jgi:hypothetical protein
MLWAAVSVVGFVLVTGLVVVMARGNTARWERDHRAPQAAARAHGAAMRRAWSTTLARWQQAQEPGDRRARRPALHLPAGLAAHLPHPHLPHPHLPHLPVHLRLPHPQLRRRARPEDRDDSPGAAGEDAGS